MSWVSSAISTVGGALFGGDDEEKQKAEMEAQSAQQEAQRYEQMLEDQKEQQDDLMKTIAETQKEDGLDTMELMMIAGGFLVVLTLVIMFMK